MIKTFDERKVECSEEIRLILKKFGMELDCTVVLGAGTVTPMIDLVEAKKEDRIIKL